MREVQALPAQGRPQMATFIYRLSSALVTGAAFLLTAYSAYFALFRLPAFKNIFKDFGAALPRATVLLLDYPWVLLAMSLVALLVAVASVFVVNRVLIAAACAALLAAMLAVAFAEFAVQMPLVHLVQSVSGG